MLCTVQLGLIQGQLVYTPTSLQTRTERSIQSKPRTEDCQLSVSLAEIFAGCSYLQPTQLHPKPTKGFLCLIALSSIRAASGKESSPRPINSLSTQFNPVQPSTSTTHPQQNGPFGTLHHVSGLPPLSLCLLLQLPQYHLVPAARSCTTVYSEKKAMKNQVKTAKEAIGL